MDKQKNGFETEQESLWVGEFGNAYTERNATDQILAGKIALYSEILKYTKDVHSVLELGANRGLNLRALKMLIPKMTGTAVEINHIAAEECRKISNIDVFEGSIYDYPISDNKFDLALTQGVLIHIDQGKLPYVYDCLLRSSARYILIAEYYNPYPMEIPYRGKNNSLFKRDFAAEIMQRAPGLSLLHYGFVYHGDPTFPLDDITWFLMEKRNI